LLSLKNSHRFALHGFPADPHLTPAACMLPSNLLTCGFVAYSFWCLVLPSHLRASWKTSAACSPKRTFPQRRRSSIGTRLSEVLRLSIWKLCRGWHALIFSPSSWNRQHKLLKNPSLFASSNFNAALLIPSRTCQWLWATPWRSRARPWHPRASATWQSHSCVNPWLPTGILHSAPVCRRISICLN